MTAALTRMRTLAALGPANLARVLWYRGALKLGIHPAQRIAAPAIPPGPFFAPPEPDPAPAPPVLSWVTNGLLFGFHHLPVGNDPPRWTIDPLAQRKGHGCDPPPETLPAWWRIPDFGGGDIKRVWELSRFDWALAFAQQARAGNVQAFARLERWTADWTRANPPFRGPNWKCAQETSIRLMRLALAALLLDGEGRISPALQALVAAHLARIEPTLSYARAQDNNHATSEAAALFIAGAWFVIAGIERGKRWEERGRRLLEAQVARLFAGDGSFSQYSLNYHRLALDTLSLAEVWRRRAGLASFTDNFARRALAAGEWLRTMVDPSSGDAPNLGANDGANLLPLTDARYRDHRPSVQLASALFDGAAAYPAGPWDAQLAWLGLSPPTRRAAPLPSRAVFDDGGYAVLRHGPAMAVLRYPRFRFRPSQADALHVDLWLAGANVLRDGGSYSYNTDACWIDYFGGVRSHNTVEFDDAPQMPRLSRFLLGDWLEAQVRDLTAGGFVAGYRHRAGWTHRREVQLGEGMRVIDTISGGFATARLRWRLAPGAWRVAGDGVTNGHHRLTIAADMPLASLALNRGWESRHYLSRTEIPVLEVVVKQPGTIVSNYRIVS